MVVKSRNRGISLISLIITIIVIIILAAIVIFNGMNTPDSAQYAKFTSDISNLQEVVDAKYNAKYSEYAVSGKKINDVDIYRWVAAGDHPTTSGMVMVPSSVGSDYGATLPNKDANGNSLVWYVKVLSESEKEIVEIDKEHNQLGTTLPNYEGRTWKLRLADGKVILDPPYEYNGNLYASMDDVIKGGATGNSDGSFDMNSRVNSPVLADGMIPVYHDGSVWRKADSTNSASQKWYDYGKKQWANVVTVKSSERSRYVSAEVGTEVKEDDVIGYFVWIPRYAYKINEAAQMVDIVFLKGTTDEFDGGIAGIENDYITHPVFTNDPVNGGWDSKLSGIWVAKFESSSSETQLVEDTGYTTVKADAGTKVISTGNGKISNTTGNKFGSTGSGYVTVRPGVTSWRNISVSSASSYARAMASNHGLILDSHMMKNTEWGAVAYLTQSKYGNASIWNNPYNEGELYLTTNNGNYGVWSFATTLTGMAGESQNEATDYYAEKIAKSYNADGSITIKYKNINSNGSAGNEYSKTFHPYNSSNGQKASTTGNIYGIYDMSGGAWEYMAAYVDNGSSYLNSYKTGLSGKYANIYVASSSDNGTSETTDSARQDNYLANANVKGDAVYETSSVGNSWNGSWNGDYASFPAGSYPFFLRGAYFYYGSGAGVFAFDRNYGGGSSRSGFRVVLVP